MTQLGSRHKNFKNETFIDVVLIPQKKTKKTKTNKKTKKKQNKKNNPVGHRIGSVSEERRFWERDGILRIITHDSDPDSERGGDQRVGRGCLSARLRFWLLKVSSCVSFSFSSG